jgi:secondary thiamine-phosphate synthase enzyme
LNLSGEERVSFLIPCLKPDREIMTVKSHELKFRTSREGEILDLTDQIQGIVESSELKDGVVTLFVPGSTGALTTIEYEPGLLADFPLALERLAPKDATYEHEDRWHDGNGHSHIRASMIGPDMSVPFLDKKLTLGTWQQIVFLELDVRPRDRTVIVQLVGD